MQYSGIFRAAFAAAGRLARLWCRRSIDDLLWEVVGLRYGSSLHLLLNEIRENQAGKMQMRCRGYDHAADPTLTSTVCCARPPAPILAC